jgi:myo-inositol-1(or 4)-monophosphatase
MADEHTRREQWLRVAREAAIQGGEEIRRYYATGLAVTVKRGDDLVTEADLASERRIATVLRSAEPGFGLVSEEVEQHDADAEFVWLIDPLDGTNNFAIDFPYVGVAVTLLRQGTPVVAVVHNPLLGTTWTAIAGGGARRDGAPIQVGASRSPERAVVAYVQGYSSDHTTTARTLGVLSGRVKRVLSNWAPALDWCLLAHGGIDAVISLDSEAEDQLGGALIAREAGALLVDLAGHDAAPSAPRLLAAASPAMRDYLVDCLARS